MSGEIPGHFTGLEDGENISGNQNSGLAFSPVSIQMWLEEIPHAID